MPVDWGILWARADLVHQQVSGEMGSRGGFGSTRKLQSGRWQARYGRQGALWRRYDAAPIRAASQTAIFGTSNPPAAASSIICSASSTV